jgi:hypothetical protein
MLSFIEPRSRRTAALRQRGAKASSMEQSANPALACSALVGLFSVHGNSWLLCHSGLSKLREIHRVSLEAAKL